MAGMTLVESAKYSTDILQSGVIETMAKENAVIELLPFMEIEGNSYQYNVETALPNVEFRAINTGYTAGVGEVERKTENLVILGGDVDLDRFIVKTRSNVNDIRAIQTAMKAKAVANTYATKFFKGDSTGSSNEFDGLIKRCAGAQTITANLTLSSLNELLDSVEGGADVLFMSKTTKRAVMKILQESNHYIENGSDSFGRPVVNYGGVPIRTVEDSVLEAGHIFAVKFGVMEAVSGLTAGGVMVSDLGELDALPVLRTRIEFYCGLAMFHPKSAGYLAGTVTLSVKSK